MTALSRQPAIITCPAASQVLTACAVLTYTWYYFTVYLAQFDQHEHDVDKASLERQDRQNFLGPVKLSGVKVSACLEDMQNGGQAVR